MFPVGLYLLVALGHRKIHKHPVPLAGGLAVITGLAVPILAVTAWVWLGPLPESFDRVVTYGLDKRGWQLAAILGGAVAMLALGIIDDR